MHRLSLVIAMAAITVVGTPLRAQAQGSSAPTPADTNPYANIPRLEFTAQALPGNPAPNIPWSLLDSLALPAEAAVMVIVDTTGHIDLRSVRVRRMPDPRLEPYVREALARWRFKPATYLGQPVRSIVFIPFVVRR